MVQKNNIKEDFDYRKCIRRMEDVVNRRQCTPNEKKSFDDGVKAAIDVFKDYYNPQK